MFLASASLAGEWKCFFIYFKKCIYFEYITLSNQMKLKIKNKWMWHNEIYVTAADNQMDWILPIFAVYAVATSSSLCVSKFFLFE